MGHDGKESISWHAGKGRADWGDSRVRELLAQLPLFQRLPDDVLEATARGTQKIRAERRSVVFHRGDPCTGFYIVVYGQVKLLHETPDGQQRIVRLIRPGHSFGEAIMFLGREQIVTAEALNDALLLHVGRQIFLDQLDRHPRLARSMLESLSQRLYMLMGDMGAFTLYSGLQRMAGYLLREWERAGRQPFRIEASKVVIASRLNLTPEHFSRILRELIDRQLLRVNGAELTVLDADGLKAYKNDAFLDAR